MTQDTPQNTHQVDSSISETPQSPQPQQPTEIQKPFVSLWWALYVVFAIGYPLFSLWTVSEPPPHLGTVAPFVLTKQDGEPVHFGKDDRPVIVNFIYTRCPDICPLLTTKMAQIQKRIPAEDALLMSISVDPNYDTPAVLHQYGSNFDADFERWYFLTGEESQTRAVVESFQTIYETIPQEDTDTTPNILHSEQFVLVDEFGSIRGFFDDSPQGLNKLLKAVDAL